ncbi:homoserine O-acetyltransferase [Mycena rosella]|uniref:Homoserine O-acetyltransferase n=1 Tax=Mycena rosella TaxID=1033263 RepID=A0AAD7DPZ1_MYCRO|nr:homoserine O-acetyltransferase [Mycena rosella]
MSTIPNIDQHIYVVPSFTLECGTELKEAPVAYKTWGRLNEARDNVMVICHALTGSADVEDWWGPLMGRNKAFDPSRFFIFCANALGSPYGSASPVTINPATGRPYGPAFPPTSIRDDVRIHYRVLAEHLHVQRVAVVIGGSMGGMAALEWPLLAPPHFVTRIAVLATSARHSAWCIAWGESQRQSIYSDPAYKDGLYAPAEQPRSGLAAARMCALLTYRSRDSFERRFGRNVHLAVAPAPMPRDDGAGEGLMTPPASPAHEHEAAELHNDGHRNASVGGSDASARAPPMAPKPPIFSAQSYLRYQGEKFIARFDANCYIHITRKMDTHDIARGRVHEATAPLDDPDGDLLLSQTLAALPPRALVISIQSDGLFTPPEQALLACHIPDSALITIPSGEGHDGFLVEFEEINRCVLGWLRGEFAGMYEGAEEDGREGEDDFSVKKESVFGEAEVDFVRW